MNYNNFHIIEWSLPPHPKNNNNNFLLLIRIKFFWSFFSNKIFRTVWKKNFKILWFIIVFEMKVKWNVLSCTGIKLTIFRWWELFLIDLSSLSIKMVLQVKRYIIKQFLSNNSCSFFPFWLPREILPHSITSHHQIFCQQLRQSNRLE